MICANCIHYDVCCNEGVDDEALTFCRDFKDKSKFIEMPCHIDDTVYAVWITGDVLGVKMEIVKLKVYGVEKNKYRTWICYDNGDRYFSVSDIGRIYFFNREEAEAKLKELESEHNDE